jgi:hypothetical protein
VHLVVYTCTFHASTLQSALNNKKTRNPHRYIIINITFVVSSEKTTDSDLTGLTFFSNQRLTHPDITMSLLLSFASSDSSAATLHLLTPEGMDLLGRLEKFHQDEFEQQVSIPPLA